MEKCTPSKNDFYCSCCDVDLKSKPVFDSHVKGRKHKRNESAAQEKHNAECSIFVSGVQVLANKESVLRSHFSSYGKISRITFGQGFAFVRFDNRESARHALKKSHHRYKELHFTVSEYKYKQLKVEKTMKKTKDEHEAIRDMLHQRKDISQQFNFMTEHLLLTKDDLEIRENICKDLFCTFSPFFENFNINQFGSSINGYGMQGCDLDLFLDFKVNPETSRVNHSQDKVKFVCQILRTSRRDTYRDVCVVPSKRCPLVKFTHYPSGLKCDLSLNNKKALYNSRLLKLYGQDPRVQQLVVVIRYWARVQQLTSPGGTTVLLTSYALTWLVLYYLFHRKPRVIPLVEELPVLLKREGLYEESIDAHKCLNIPLSAALPPSQNQESTADLLHGFFQFYASSVNWEHEALSTWDGHVLPKQSLRGDPLYADCKVGVMTMLDPFVLSHNILANVNERAMARFETEIKKALEVTKKWDKGKELNSKDNGKPWGLEEIFIPSPPDPPKSKKESRYLNKLSLEQKSGVFTISLHPPSQLLTSEEFVSRAEKMNMTPNAFWCSLVKKMIVNILETVYFIDVQETSVEDIFVNGESYVKTEDREMDPVDVNMDVEYEESCSVSEDSGSEEKHLDEAERVCCDEKMNDNANKKNSNHSRSEASKRLVQKVNDIVNKKPRRDAESKVKEVELEYSEKENVSTRHSSIADISEEYPESSLEDSSCSIVEDEKIISKIVSEDNREEIEILEEESIGTKAVSTLPSSKFTKNDRRNSKDSLVTTFVPGSTAESTHSPISSESLSGVDGASERLNDAIRKVVGNLKKITKIWSYTCCTKHAMWLYRGQLRNSMAGNKTLQGLALERMISEKVVAKLNKLYQPSSETVNRESSFANVKESGMMFGAALEDRSKMESINTGNVEKSNQLEKGAKSTSDKSPNKSIIQTFPHDKLIKCSPNAKDERQSISKHFGKGAEATGKTKMSAEIYKSLPAVTENEKSSPPDQRKGKNSPLGRGKNKTSPLDNGKGKNVCREDRKSSPQGKDKSDDSSTKTSYLNYEVPFSCKIIESHSEGKNSFPSVSIVMHTDQASSFRNVYASASNTIVRLVASHLMDIDGLVS